MWYKDGIKFECQGSGKCCVSHGEYGFVYMTKEDRIRMARALNMPTSSFTREHCVKEDGVYRLIDGEQGDCQFLDGKQCGVYKGRPTQCRTWPFWPEVMDAKVWKKEVASFCPGVGKGRLWTKDEIESELRAQQDSENRFGS